MQINATLGTKIFCFRTVIDLGGFNNDLDAIIIILVRSNLVEKIFSLSDGQTQRTFSIAAKGGIDSVNASRVFPEIRLIENRRVIYEDCVIYQEAPLPVLELPTTLDFDLNLIVIGPNLTAIEELSPFAVGTVALTMPIDSCQNNNCTNTSSENVNVGYFNCSQVINGCEPNPCQNDAMCTNHLYGSFTCLCNTGWTGDRCEVDIDYCALNFTTSTYGPCDEIGAIGCIDGNSTYLCVCAVGFTGYNCSDDIDECDPNLCQNDAICTNLNASFECLCGPGWTGALCDIDIDYCASNSSIYGPCDEIGSSNCTDGNSTYYCSCAVGFAGYNCSEDINECEPDPCQNGATCTNHLFGLFECHCYPGWSGELCDIDIDYCASDLSLHGPCDDTGAINCTDGNLTYTCTCAVGYTGYNCSEDIDECDPNPCQNGGHCTDQLHGLYECECPRGFSGQTCNILFDVCAPSQPCRNELTCTRGMYNCNCLCIAQCPLFTFGNHSTGDCQPCKFINNCTSIYFNHHIFTFKMYDIIIMLVQFLKTMVEYKLMLLLIMVVWR